MEAVMAKPKIRATKVNETANRTVWLVEWVYPAMSGKWGKSYYVTTYPSSDLLYLETAAKRRQVAKGTATKITPQIREALAAAQA
jgi:hypothetical protein